MAPNQSFLCASFIAFFPVAAIAPSHASNCMTYFFFVFVPMVI
jgi:hypothetical protein